MIIETSQTCANCTQSYSIEQYMHTHSLGRMVLLGRIVLMAGSRGGGSWGSQDPTPPPHTHTNVDLFRLIIRGLRSMKMAIPFGGGREGVSEEVETLGEALPL